MDNSLKKTILEDRKDFKEWRVKELLKTAIGASSYDEELYYEYAKTLFNLGDYIESGKIFLLVNTHEEKYLQASQEFLDRHFVKHVYSTLPKFFKRIRPEDYPYSLIQALNRNIELKKQILLEAEYHHKIKERSIQKERISDDIIGYLFVAAIVLPYIIGVVAIVKYLISLF